MWTLHERSLLIAFAFLFSICNTGSGSDKSSERFLAELKPVADGALRRLKNPYMNQFKMSAELPPGLKKGINDPTAMYCVVPTQVTSTGMYVGVTESADSKSGNLYLDLNGDGDLTNDPLPEDLNNRWVRRGPVAFEAEAEVNVEGRGVKLRFFRYAGDFVKNQKALLELGNPLFLHRDDAWEGTLRFGISKYKRVVERAVGSRPIRYFGSLPRSASLEFVSMRTRSVRTSSKPWKNLV